MLDPLKPNPAAKTMGSDLRAREVVSRRMAALCWPILMLGSLGCQHVGPLVPESSTASEPPGATVATPDPRTAHLEDTKHRLVQQLDAVERRLVHGDEPGDSGDELRDQRLVLIVALVRMDQDIDAAQRGDLFEIQNVEQRLVMAEKHIERARQRLAEGKDRHEDLFLQRDKWHVSKMERPLGLDERTKRLKHKRRSKSSRRCSPNDPLCFDDWDEGGDLEEEGAEVADLSKPDMPPPAAPPPVEPVDGTAEPEPVPPYGPAAARVSHAATPDGVASVVARQHQQLVACLPESLRSRGLRLRVRCRLDAQGAFREPRVVAADIDPRVAACIVDVFRQMRLAGHSEGSRMITVPLWLSSSQ